MRRDAQAKLLRRHRPVLFKLGNNLNQRDTIACGAPYPVCSSCSTRRVIMTKEAVRRCLEYALEARRRVKTAQKLAAWNSSTSTSPTSTRRHWKSFVSVPEQGATSSISDGPLNPGVLHTVATGGNGHLGPATDWSADRPVTVNSMCLDWDQTKPPKGQSRSHLTTSRPASAG